MSEKKIKFMVMQSPSKERIENVLVMKQELPSLIVKPAAPPNLFDQFCDCFDLEEEYDGLVLLEDDVQLCKGFEAKILEVIEQHPEDVISFFEAATSRKPVISGYYKGAKFAYTQCDYFPRSRCELFFNKDNRKKFLDYCVEKEIPVKYPVDTYIAYTLKNNKLSYYMHEPFLVQHQPFKSMFQGRSTTRQSSYFIDDYHPLKTTHVSNQVSKICVGYTREEKQQAVYDLLDDYPDIKHIVYFSPTGMEVLDLSGVQVTVKRKTFFEAMCFKHSAELFEEIDKNYLIIYDECMRVKKRRDLTYNSFHRYGHMVGYQLVFETFPMIDDPDDFLILIDLAYPDRYIQAHFTEDLLDNPDIDIKQRSIILEREPVVISEGIAEAYEAETERLFDEIGNKDPNTIPRNLVLWVGTHCKKRSIKDKGIYLARNARFKKENVRKYSDYSVYDNETYTTMSYETHAKNEYTRYFDEIKTATVIDFPARHKEFMDFLKFSNAQEIKVMNTGLSIDSVMFDEYNSIFETMKSTFYKGGGDDGR